MRKSLPAHRWRKFLQLPETPLASPCSNVGTGDSGRATRQPGNLCCQRVRGPSGPAADFLLGALADLFLPSMPGQDTWFFAARAPDRNRGSNETMTNWSSEFAAAGKRAAKWDPNR